MSERAAIVTGASRGIGRAIAEALAEDGYSLTISARKPDTLEATAAEFRDKGYEVEPVAANMADEDGIRSVVQRHREHFGRLDVLVNNAGVGIGAAVAEQQAEFVDMQIGVNLRAIILFYRECAEMLRAAGAEHSNAVVVNLSSFAGKSGQPWLSVYSATKAGVVGYTQAMNKELNAEGVKSVAFCPGFVDTDMTEFIKGSVDAGDMMRPRTLPKRCGSSYGCRPRASSPKS